VIDALMKGQRPSRGYLGVGLQPLDETRAPALGLPKDSGEIVRTVVAGGPGDRGGLQQGDVIVGVNGQAVTPDQTVSFLIANTPAGSRVPLEIVRNGRRQTVTVQVGQRPPEDEVAQQGGYGSTPGGTPNEQPAVAPQKALGLSLTPLTADLARAANLPAGSRGVIVTGVDPNSDAADDGFQRGDLIISVNNQPVTTPAQVVAAVDAARKAGRSSVLLLVKRGNTPEQFVGVDIAPR
jgi:serine protease Do